MLNMSMTENVSEVSLSSLEFELQTLVITASIDYTEYRSPKNSLPKIHKKILILKKRTLYVVLYVF